MIRLPDREGIPRRRAGVRAVDDEPVRALLLAEPADELRVVLGGQLIGGGARSSRARVTKRRREYDGRAKGREMPVELLGEPPRVGAPGSAQTSAIEPRNPGGAELLAASFP